MNSQPIFHEREVFFGDSEQVSRGVASLGSELGLRLSELFRHAGQPLFQPDLPVSVDRQVFRPVAGHAADLAGGHVLSLCDVVTGFTADAGEIHRRRTRGNAFTPDAAVKVPHRRMPRGSAVADSAPGGQRFLPIGNFVNDLDVTVETFDLVVGHVLPVEKLRFPVSIQALDVIVTGVATLAGNVSVAFDDSLVTQHAIHVETLDLAMVERKPSRLDSPLGNFVTQGASGRSFIQGLALEVTKEASGGSHGDVTPLHDL